MKSVVTFNTVLETVFLVENYVDVRESGKGEVEKVLISLSFTVRGTLKIWEILKAGHYY